MARPASETPWSPWDPTGSPRETFRAMADDVDLDGGFLERAAGPGGAALRLGRQGANVAREAAERLPDVRIAGPGGAVARLGAAGVRGAGRILGIGGNDGSTPNLVEDPAAGWTPYQPPAGPAGDPFADIARVGRQFADAAGQVDANYQSRLDELRDMYQLAETPEEKAQLQFMLGNIEAQREAGHQVIRNAYQEAIGQSKQTASQMRGQAAQDADTFHSLFTGAAGDVRQGIDETAARYADSGLGVGATPVSGDATDFVQVLEAAAPREAALAQQLGNIAADDVAFLGQALSGEQTAQQGQLERLALQLAAQTQAGHMQQVNQRIGQDRRALAGQAFQMGNRYEDRRWDMEDTARQLELDLAEQRRQAEGGGETIIPADPFERDLFVQNLLAEYGAAIVPTLVEHGLLPPDYEYDPLAGLE